MFYFAASEHSTEETCVQRFKFKGCHAKGSGSGGMLLPPSPVGARVAYGTSALVALHISAGRQTLRRRWQ